MALKTVLLSIIVMATSAGLSYAQGCHPQAPNDSLPGWAAYKDVCFYQTGDSLYVGITFEGPISSRPSNHAGNTFYVDFDDNPATGQQGGGRVGSEMNLTFNDWAGVGTWIMEIFGPWNQAANSFSLVATAPAMVTGDTTLWYKMSLVGLGLTDVAYDVNGYWLDGYIWSAPYHPGAQLDSVELYSFDPTQVTPLDTIQDALAALKIPQPYDSTAKSLNILGTLDNIVRIVDDSLGKISENVKYTVAYNDFTDYPIMSYNSPPNNSFTTYLPGDEWTSNPNYWAMLQGATFQTISELRKGFDEIFQTDPGTAYPLPGTQQTWYDTTLDYNHGLLFNIDHQQTFKALLGNAYQNLLDIYLGMNSGDQNLVSAATSTLAKADSAYNAFNGTAFDLNPWIMTGFLHKKLGPDLSWTMKLWRALPITYTAPTDTSSGDKFGTFVAPVLDNGMSWNSPDSTRRFWYQNIASVQAGAIDAVTGKDIYDALKTIPDYPTVDSIYQQSKALFATLTSIVKAPAAVPLSFRVDQNYPNPFNPSTLIKFTLPERLHVEVRVYDVLGRMVQTLVNGTLGAGQHEVTWDGSRLPSGVYFYRVIAGSYSSVKKAILLK